MKLTASTDHQTRSEFPAHPSRLRVPLLAPGRASASPLRSHAVAAALFAALTTVAPAASDAEIKALREELALLRARVAELETRVAEAPARSGKSILDEPPAPRVTARPDGFRVKSDDGAFELRAGGLLQAQGRFFTDGLADGDTFLIRRARPILEGRVWEQFRFRLMPELANDVTLLDAYAEWVPSDLFALRIGKMKAPSASNASNRRATSSSWTAGCPRASSRTATSAR